MDHKKLVTEHYEQSVQYDDDLQIQCCCHVSILAFASILTIICAVICLITAITFAPFPMGPPLVITVTTIGFACGIIFMVGGIYICTRPRTKYQKLPISEARNRKNCAWALFTAYVIIDIALLTGSIMSFISGGVINPCDSCAITTILFSVCFIFFLFCLFNSVIVAILGVKLSRYHVETNDEASNSREIEAFYTDL